MPIRIAYLANFAPKKLGTGEDRLMLLAKEANNRGHSLTMFCHEPVHPSVRHAFRRNAVSIRALRKLGNDVIAGSRLLAANFDIVVLNAIAPRSRTAFATYLAWPCKVVYVDHNSGPVEDVVEQESSLVRRLIDKLTVVRISSAAGVSNYVSNRLQQRFGFAAGKLITLYGGINVERYRGETRTTDPDRTIEITVVAALIREKGIDSLLHALAEIQDLDWSLSIVGEGPDKNRLQHLCDTLGLRQRVEFFGLRDDVPDILRSTDIFVHPAIWQEALGYTILEGMVSGCAVIATETGGIPELISDGENGLLYEAGNVPQLQKRLQRLIDDSDLRQHLSENGRKTVEERFSLAANIENTLNWLESVAAKNG